MAYCPKCGARVREDMSFCPKCGADLKVTEPQPLVETATAAPPAPAEPYRAEKAEKGEKGEKREKQEKGEKEERHEKGEFGFVGPLVGGVILLVIGFFAYLVVTGSVSWQAFGAVFFILIGVIVIIAAVYVAMTAARRHPPT